MQYSIGKLVKELDEIDALECLGFNSFDSLCMANNLSSVVYFKTNSREYFSQITKRVMSLVNFESEQYLNWRLRQTC